ncbi:MAG TPA: PadR family transcriptional regulator [Solirubrobacteraceae bacterium]|jgi:DNA-binding PadR family transcriptional regulator|nr:PadR family transcriptional regulator [Solirubrobacteraceae bacterium]
MTAVDASADAAAGERKATPMHSPISWALLGLVIERPSYAYELAQRFERTYGDALTLSSIPHAYRALRTLEDRGMIEELPGTRTGRQPKPHYRATAKGLADYHQRLLGEVAEERRRQHVFLLQLTALARDPLRAIEVVEDYERTCLGETRTSTVAAADDGAPDVAHDLRARLIAEKKRLTLGARIAWARYARSELKTLAAQRASEQQADGRALDP